MRGETTMEQMRRDLLNLAKFDYNLPVDEVAT